MKILDLKDCVVTIDAIGCQHKIVEQITSEGGDYLISVKENQRKLHDKIESFFSSITLEGNKKRVEDTYLQLVMHILYKKM